MKTMSEGPRHGWRGVLSLVGLIAVGCAAPASGDGSLGEVRLALSLPDGTTVSSVTWKISSSTNATLLSGSLDVSGSQKPTFIASIAPGAGDTVTMSATTSVGVICAGTSDPFDVVAGHTVNVPVNLLCQGTVSDAGIGGLVVTGTIVSGDHCPVLTSYLIDPQTSGAADPINVSVGASDPDTGESLTYLWSATSGTFTSATSLSTQYHCVAGSGAQTLSVQVSDNHTPLPCTTSITFPSIDCL
jgi:hypothetical protein